MQPTHKIRKVVSRIKLTDKKKQTPPIGEGRLTWRGLPRWKKFDANIINGGMMFNHMPTKLCGSCVDSVQ